MDLRLFVSHSFLCIEIPIYLVLHDSYKIKKNVRVHKANEP